MTLPEKRFKMWNCPNCNRPFKHRNQAHSCVTRDPEDILFGKDIIVRATYEKLLEEVRKFGKIHVSPTRNAIMLKGRSTFVAVKPKREVIDIEFLLAEERDEPPVNKIVQVSKRRYAHFVR
jgi:hypothetical protein